MKTTMNYFASFGGSLRRLRAGLLMSVALVLCLTTPASAAWKSYTNSVPFAIVSAGSTQVWALDTSGGVYQYNSGKNAFEHIKGNLVQLAVGTGNQVWGINLSGEIYQYNFTTKAFQKVAGTLQTIAAGGQGIWGVYAGEEYVWDSVTKSFAKPTHELSGGKWIYVGSYGIGVWVLDPSGNAWLYNTDNDYFDETNGVLMEIAVGNDQVWGTASDNSVWQYDVTTEKWIKPDPSAQLAEMSAGDNNDIWGVNLFGAVFKFDQTTQKFVDQNAKSGGGGFLILAQISVSSASAGVWAVDIDGTIWKP